MANRPTRGHRIAREIMAALEVRDEDLLTGAYADMLAEGCRNGETIRAVATDSQPVGCQKRKLRMSKHSITSQPISPIPEDDPQRRLVVARPNSEESLPHVGLAGDTYTVVLSGGRYRWTVLPH